MNKGKAGTYTILSSGKLEAKIVPPALLFKIINKN
jgi:hypothetical protein